MIEELARTLVGYTDDQWRRYAFRHEPLADRLTDEQQRAVFVGALACGAEQAALLRERYPDMGVTDIVAAEGVPLKLDTTEYDGVFTTFATHSVEDGILIYADNARATDRMIEQEHLENLSGGVKTEDLLAAHELFHHVENTTDGLFIQQKHVLLFRIGKFEHRSALLSLSEAAAMAFAKQLTGLPCNPYVFDVLMLYPKNPQRAVQQFDIIQRACESERSDEE